MTNMTRQNRDGRTSASHGPQWGPLVVCKERTAGRRPSWHLVSSSVFAYWRRSMPLFSAEVEGTSRDGFAENSALSVLWLLHFSV